MINFFYFPLCKLGLNTCYLISNGKRSLYYHVRNFWLWAFKYVAWSKVLTYPLAFLAKGLGKTKKVEGITDAVGTIGLFDNIKSVRGGYWICVKATLAALCESDRSDQSSAGSKLQPKQVASLGKKYDRFVLSLARAQIRRRSRDCRASSR